MKTLRDFAVGQTFELVRHVDRYRPIYYAAASGDFNPIHVDPRVGRAAGLGGNILHGMCTFAWLSDACAAFFEDPVRVRRIRARFTRPVRPGDAITFSGRCTAIEGERVRVEVTAANQRGAEVLTCASAEAVIGELRAPRGDAEPAGRRYGPYRFTVGLEHVRDFVAASGMGVPGRVGGRPPAGAHPWSWDEEAAASSPHGGIVAPPSYAATFAIEPFAAACTDPALGIDLLRLVHGEQELELFGPIRPGDVLTTTGEVSRVKRRGKLDIYDVTTTSVNQHGEVVVRGTWTAVVRGGAALGLLLAARRLLGAGR